MMAAIAGPKTKDFKQGDVAGLLGAAGYVHLEPGAQVVSLGRRTDGLTRDLSCGATKVLVIVSPYYLMITVQAGSSYMNNILAGRNRKRETRA